jgi:putative phosphoesterase
MQTFSSIRRFAVISDTHGLLRDAVLPLLQGTDIILHAGDVGTLPLLRQLEKIAPLVAVRGNVDHALAFLPETELVSINDRLVYLLHDLHLLDLDPASAGLAMVVSGHSHRPSLVTKDEVIYLNPGSIGPRRFKLPVAFAITTVDTSPWTVQMIDLQTDA